jgi:two-component system, cell cycle sensor histidine kinase PleC
MAVAVKPALPDGLDGAPSLDLTSEAQAVVAIDPQAAEILAANRPGGAALGLFPYASFPVAFDPAMPAIARLRTVASVATSAKGDVETLLFWSSGRLRRIKCRVSRWQGNAKILLLFIEAVEAPDRGFTAARGQPIAATAVPAEHAAVERTKTLRGEPKATVALDPDYLAKLAHELKTPLTAIAAASEIMRDERLGKMKNARYLSYAADIHESATHALDVICSLLSDRAKPAALPSRLVALDLNAIVERTVSSVQALADACGLSLAFETDGRTPHVVANPTALRQVLLNLLTNAIKFTPRGGDVRVETRHVEEGRVLLVVCDTGCGIGGTNGDGLQTSTVALKTPLARGYGIGLPLVESLVRDMGAEIHIESAPQKGTVASILFGDFARHFK